MTVSEQTGIRCVLMRGGTSKGLYFHEADLPGPGPQRDAMLLRLMGSPDVLQIDGLGGSRPITSKAAIIAPSAHGHADVDYTFAQVGVDRPTVDYGGNCGNMSSAIGPFAVDEQLVRVRELHRVELIGIYWHFVDVVWIFLFGILYLGITAFR